MYAVSSATRDHEPPLHSTECRVRPVRVNSKAEPEWVGSGTRDMRRAAHEHTAFELMQACAETAHEPMQDVGMQPPGLIERQSIPLADLTNKHTRQMLVTPTPVMPRAWDPARDNAHFAALYPHLSTVAYIASMKRIFASARHDSIPPRIRDVLYRTLVSGHQIGGMKRQGCTATCARCMEHEETLEHAYATCESVRTLWAMVLDRWEAATKERLDPDDLRITLLGDRGDEDLAVSRDMWRLVHAATMWTVHRTAAEARAQRGEEHYKKPSPMDMLVRTQRELQRLITAAWIVRGKAGKQLPWGTWREEQWVVCRAGNVSVRVLQRGQDRAEGWRVNVPVAAVRATRTEDEHEEEHETARNEMDGGSATQQQQHAHLPRRQQLAAATTSARQEGSNYSTTANDGHECQQADGEEQQTTEEAGPTTTESSSQPQHTNAHVPSRPAEAAGMSRATHSQREAEGL